VFGQLDFEMPLHKKKVPNVFTLPHVVSILGVVSRKISCMVA